MAAFENSLEKIARLLSSKHGVTVVFRGSECHTNGKVITLPVVTSQTDDDFVSILQGYLDHEVGHIIFSQLDQVAAEFPENPGPDDKRLHQLWNALEDPRINRKMGAMWSGSGVNIRRTYAWVSNKIKEAGGWDNVSDWGLFAQLVTITAENILSADRFVDVENAIIAKYPDTAAAVQKVRPIIEKLRDLDLSEYVDLRGSLKVLDLAREILDTFKSDDDDDSLQGDGDPCEDGDDSDDAEDGESSGEAGEGGEDSDGDPSDSDGAPGEGNDDDSDDSDGDPSDSDGESGEGNDDSDAGDDDSDDESGGGSGGEDGDEGDDDSDEAGDGSEGADSEYSESDSDSDGQADDGGGAGETDEDGLDDGIEGGGGNRDGEAGEASEDSESGHDDYEGEYEHEGVVDVSDAVETPWAADDCESGVRPEEIIGKHHKDGLVETDEYRVYTTEGDVIEAIETTDADRAAFANMLAEVKKLTAAVAGPLTRNLLATKYAGVERDLTSGSLDMGALYKLGLAKRQPHNQDFRKVFEQVTEAARLDTVVVITIDHSGSMSGQPLRLALETGIIIGEVLHQVGIPFEIIGHSTVDYYKGEERLREYCRKNGVLDESTAPFCRWDDLWIGVYKAFDESWPKVKERLATCRDKFNNIDGEALQYACKRVLEHGSQYKRKIVIELKDGYPHPGCNYYFQGAHYANLKRVVKDAEEAGIEVIAVGIQTNCVSRFYKHWVQVDELKELPGVVLGELGTILRGGAAAHGA